jgi:hypothetical protein
MPGASGRGVLPLLRARCCHRAILLGWIVLLEELLLEGVIVYAVIETVVMVQVKTFKKDCLREKGLNEGGRTGDKWVSKFIDIG